MTPQKQKHREPKRVWRGIPKSAHTSQRHSPVRVLVLRDRPFGALGGCLETAQRREVCTACQSHLTQSHGWSLQNHFVAVCACVCARARRYELIIQIHALTSCVQTRVHTDTRSHIQDCLPFLPGGLRFYCSLVNMIPVMTCCFLFGSWPDAGLRGRRAGQPHRGWTDEPGLARSDWEPGATLTAWLSLGPRRREME